MGRAFWFAVGAGAGLYGSLKARRLAYRVSPAGLGDQAAALRLGARALAEDIRAGARQREAELRDGLDLPPRQPPAGPGLPAGDESTRPVPLHRPAHRTVDKDPS